MTKESGTDVDAYIKSKEMVVNINYACLWEQNVSEQFYVEAGGYCGPGSAPISDPDENEEALGLRCSEGNCCGAAGPVIEQGDDAEAYAKLLKTHMVKTCQTTPEEGSTEPVTVGGWEWTCIEKSANKIVAGVSVVLAMICSYAF